MKREPLPIQVRMVEVLQAIEGAEKIAKRNLGRRLIHTLVRLYTLRDILKRQIAKMPYELAFTSAATA